MPYTTTGHSDNQPAYVRTRRALAVPELGGLIDDLVERREDVVRKLDFRDGLQALRRRTNGKPDDALLRQWRVEDSLRSELGLEIDRAAENASEGDILAEEYDVVGGSEGRSQGRVDGLVQVQALCRHIPGQLG